MLGTDGLPMVFLQFQDPLPKLSVALSAGKSVVGELVVIAILTIIICTPTLLYSNWLNYHNCLLLGASIYS